MKYRYRESHEMKDSGVEWLGMIPKEWEVKQLKYLAYSLNGFAFKSENYINHGVPIIRIGDISKFINLDNIPKVKEEIDLEKYEIKKQDILVALTGATIGKSCIYNLEEKSYLNQRVGLFRGIKIYNKFLFYYISSDMILKYIQLICNGSAQENISNLDILNFKIAFTYLNQQKIADFLDKKCEEFDSVIAKKEMLINKLEEAKKSLISEVVTGKVKVIQKENGEYGIIKRETHEMKDSGVEWLGMIPKEWQVSKLKYHFNIKSGATPKSEIKEYWDGNLNWYTPVDLGETKFLRNSKRKITEAGLKSCSVNIIKSGSVIMSSRAPIGSVSIAINDFTTNQGCKSLEFKGSMINNFIYYYILISKRNLENLGSGTTFLEISGTTFSNYQIPYLKIQEQQKIADFLDKKCSQFDIAIEKQKEIIEKLKLAKQSLISEAVTGKVEVL